MFDSKNTTPKLVTTEAINDLINNALEFTEEQIKKVRLWVKSSHDYYNDGTSELSDLDFDKLTGEILSWNNDSLNTILFGIQKQDGIEVYENNYSDEDVDEKETLMLSLKKIKFINSGSASDIIKFLELRKPNHLNQNKQIFVGGKFDGMALKLVLEPATETIYSKPKQIITRGGLDVTRKLINHPHIISAAKRFGKIGEVVIVHGEMIIKKEIFRNKYKDSFEAEITYANERNFVSGKVKSDKFPIELYDDFDFIPYSDGLNMLGDIWKDISIPTLTNLERIYFEMYKNLNFPYQVDGLVIGYVTDKQIIKDNYPMNMVAVKFKSISAQTTIIDYTFEIKKSGQIIPVFVVKPTELDGTVVKNVSAYNFATIKHKKLGIGAIITITKSGDIIPVVDKVIKTSTEYKYPNFDYSIKNDNLWALDTEVSDKYKFILGLGVLNIDGIGDKIAGDLADLFNNDIISLFDKTKKSVIGTHFGINSSVFNKINEVYDIKSIPLDQLIDMLQFDRCGKVLSTKFAKLILRMDVDTKGIDSQVLKNVCTGDGFRKIIESQNRLKSFGVVVVKPLEVNSDTLSFEMSNSPKSGITKEQFTKELKTIFPNSQHTTLTKNTTVLFVDSLSANSSKSNKARKYNIPIVVYEDALNGKFDLSKLTKPKPEEL